jgi:hypothetical protein
MALAFVYDESFDGGKIAEKPPSRVPKSSKGFARVSIFSLSWVLGSSWGSEILLYGRYCYDLNFPPNRISRKFGNVRTACGVSVSAKEKNRTRGAEGI